MKFECPKCSKKFYGISAMRVCEHESIKPVKQKREPVETELVLTEEYEALSSDFNFEYMDGGCSCHIGAPCGYCTHPGNPLCLDGNDDAWVRVPVE